MRHFLVPTDFSEAAQAAFEYAIQLCKDVEGKITLLHVAHTEKVTETLMGMDAIEYLADTLRAPSTSSGCTPSFDVAALKKVALQKLDACVDAAERGLTGVLSASDSLPQRCSTHSRTLLIKPATSVVGHLGAIVVGIPFSPTPFVQFHHGKDRQS
jgi:nucleotide-binding universal stress UspA family protein